MPLALGTVIRDRAVRGYNLDASANTELLLSEMTEINTPTVTTPTLTLTPTSSASHQYASVEEDPIYYQAYRVWSWIERTEEPLDDISSRSSRSAFSGSSTGALSLLQRRGLLSIIEGGSDSKVTQLAHAVINMTVYTSDWRILVREYCGWGNLEFSDRPFATAKNAIGNYQSAVVEKSVSPVILPAVEDLIVDICETCFERAAALCLWHGNAALSLKILQEHSAECTTISETYGAIITMIIATLTSFSQTKTNIINNSGSTSSSSSSAVASAPSSPIQILAEYAIQMLQPLKGLKHRYLEAMVRYVLTSCSSVVKDSPKTISSSSSSNNNNKTFKDFSYILDNDHLWLEDKVAFACVYLRHDEILPYVLNMQASLLATGNLEALLLCGMGVGSDVVLQQYLDKTGDVQTVALISAKYLPLILDTKVNTGSSSGGGGGGGGGESKMEIMWISFYRELLNKYELFIQRAKFDVSFAAFERSVGYLKPSNASEAYGLNKTSGNSRLVNSGNASFNLYPNSATICKKPHILIRCHFCNVSLPGDPRTYPGVNNSGSATSRKQRPLFNCCPNCHRQLPVCYVCHMYIGVVNPNLEFSRNVALHKVTSAVANAMISSGPATSVQTNTTPNPLLTVAAPASGSNSNSNSNSNIAPPSVTIATSTTPTAAAVVSYSNNNSSNSSGIGAQVDNFVLEMGQWVFFCQQCKHGGHARCMDEWFGFNCASASATTAAAAAASTHQSTSHSNHSPSSKLTSTSTSTSTSSAKISHRICGVNGCNCLCVYI